MEVNFLVLGAVPDDFLKRLYAQYYCCYKKRHRIKFSTVPLISFVILIFWAYIVWFSGWSIILVMLALYVLFAYQFITTRDFVRSSLREIKASFYYGISCAISINEERISYKYQSQGLEASATIPWQKITELLDLKDGLVFLSGEVPVYWISRFNKSDIVLQNIKILAKRNNVPIFR